MIEEKHSQTEGQACLRWARQLSAVRKISKKISCSERLQEERKTPRGPWRPAHRQCSMWVPAQFLLGCILAKGSWSKCSSTYPARQGVLILQNSFIASNKLLSDNYIVITLSMYFNDCFVLKLWGVRYCLHPSLFPLYLSSAFPLLFPINVWCTL